MGLTHDVITSALTGLLKFSRATKRRDAGNKHIGTTDGERRHRLRSGRVVLRFSPIDLDGYRTVDPYARLLTLKRLRRAVSRSVGSRTGHRPAVGSKRVVALALSACALWLTACATPDVPPANNTLPASLQARAVEVLQEVFRVHGNETYVCQRNGNQLSWHPTGTLATLVDESRHSAGVISAGGYFIATDGSYVVVRLLAQEIINASALPWQRLTTVQSSAEPGEIGRFTNVTSIQRVQTSGGLPPNPVCTVERTALYVPYSATYLFYRRGQPGVQGSATANVAQQTGKADCTSGTHPCDAK
ncbi:hypothetical protein DFQ28_008693 [Apophysomyces sp. BC1034]|nr:hypothetical protein DFQ28_008693 [Apophysomyces sp. BC1034]